MRAVVSAGTCPCSPIHWTTTSWDAHTLETELNAAVTKLEEALRHLDVARTQLATADALSLCVAQEDVGAAMAAVSLAQDALQAIVGIIESLPPNVRAAYTQLIARARAAIAAATTGLAAAREALARAMRERRVGRSRTL